MFRGDGPELVVSASLAARLAPDASAVGRTVVVDGAGAVVVGVLDGGPDGPHRAVGPFAAFAEADGPAPTLAIHAARAETVGALTAEIRDWLDGRFPDGRAAFEVASYEARAEQFRQGMLLFKLVMGLITGVSVVVGGVGVMNVLLMTVTERTREIGVRKAVGARRRDVVAQFLAEAVAVSGVGSLIGLGLGLAVVFAAAPVLRAATEVPFYAAVTPQTLAVVAAVAVAVGVVFGTYPALRAARLRPADAIRHE
jgi:putative ABC transport system permease protein